MKIEETMDEEENNFYSEIKNELVQIVIDKKVNNFFANRNELTHYYNVGKKIIEAQGGESKAEYGNRIIKKFSVRLTEELGKGYSVTTLKYMRMFYLFLKSQPLVDQSIIQINWSHMQLLLSLKDINEINYYIKQIVENRWGKRTLQEKIKNKEYQRLSSETKEKLINNKEINVYDMIKNPIYIKKDDNKSEITEKVLKTYILKDMDNFLKIIRKWFFIYNK